MTHGKVGVLSRACSFFIPFAAKVCWGWSVWNVPWMSKLMKHQKDHGHMPWMIFAPSSWRNETFSESLLLQRSFWADRRCPRLGVLQCPCLSAASSELQPTPNYLTTCPVTTSLRHVVLQVLFNIFKMMLLLFTVTWFLAACGPEEKSKVKPLESCSASIFLCPMPGILVAKPQVNHVIACGWFALADANSNSGWSTVAFGGDLAQRCFSYQELSQSKLCRSQYMDKGMAHDGLSMGTPVLRLK